MDLQAHIISSHPLFASAVVRLLAHVRGLRGYLCARACPNPQSILSQTQPCLFILDKYSPPVELPTLCRVLRARCPASKFLVLLPPERGSDEELLELLYLGVDGFVRLTGQMDEELSQAVRSVMSGGLWVPQHIIGKYVRRTNLLLNTQLRPEPALTARENQILQLVVRRWSNREIGGTLEISERTVKFHVSNILTKTRVQGRQELLATIATVASICLFAF